MNCPKCNRSHAEADAFCRFCGTPLFEKPKKRRGNLLAPWIAVVCMSVLGLILYFIQPLSSFENDTPWFTVEDGILYFDPYLYEGSSEITVPSAIGGEPVLELSGGCFSDMTQITAIHLPDSLQVIGDYAFSDCTALRGIERHEAFLKSIGMPITLKELGAKTEDIPALAAKVKRGPDGKVGAFVKLSTEDVEAILRIADR